MNRAHEQKGAIRVIFRRLLDCLVWKKVNNYTDKNIDLPSMT